MKTKTKQHDTLFVKIVIIFLILFFIIWVSMAGLYCVKQMTTNTKDITSIFFWALIMIIIVTNFNFIIDEILNIIGFN